jgi:hypothetical protein
MGRSKNSPERVRARELDRQALTLRKGGATYDQIAQRLERPVSTVKLAVKRALERLESETGELAVEMRRIEGERLDALLLGLWGKATKGDLQAVDRALKIHFARVKLFGLELPPAQGEGASETITIKFAEGEPFGEA